MNKDLARQSKAPSVLGVCITFTLLAVAATGLRLYTRFSLIKNHGLEDYCITIAATLSLLLTILIGEQVHYGMGRHFSTLPPEEFIKSLKPFWVSVWVYYLALTFTKISILIQCWRLLVYRKTRIAIWIAGGIVVAYGIATFFDSVFICHPVSYFWDQTIEGGYCANKEKLWFANAGVNIADDIGIVILPMPAVRSLGLPKRQKLGVMLLFALGGFVCIASIVRLTTLQVIATSHDITWDNPGAATWSSVETNVGIICACLPTLRPLFLKFLPLWWRSTRDRMSSSRRASEQTGTSGRPRAQIPRREISMASPISTQVGTNGLNSAPLSDPTFGGRTMYFGDSGAADSRESVEVDPDLEAYVKDGWTQQSEKRGTRVSVSLPK